MELRSSDELIFISHSIAVSQQKNGFLMTINQIVPSCGDIKHTGPLAEGWGRRKKMKKGLLFLGGVFSSVVFGVFAGGILFCFFLAPLFLVGKVGDANNLLFKGDRLICTSSSPILWWALDARGGEYTLESTKYFFVDLEIREKGREICRLRTNVCEFSSNEERALLAAASGLGEFKKEKEKLVVIGKMKVSS